MGPLTLSADMVVVVVVAALLKRTRHISHRKEERISGVKDVVVCGNHVKCGKLPLRSRSRLRPRPAHPPIQVPLPPHRPLIMASTITGP